MARRTFVGAIGCGPATARLTAAVGEGAQSIADGALRIAFTGEAPAARCLLDGSVDTLAEIAAAAELDRAALAPEALLAGAHERLGARLAPLLRGAFAIVLWDAGARRVWLLRDQMGERGVVWTRAAGGIVIGGEVADLLAALPMRPGPDEVALAHWLTVSGMPEDRTLFAGVRRLRAAHRAHIEAGTVVAERYWRPPAPPRGGPPPIARDEAVDRVRAALVRAIERCRAADGEGETAVLLSGGLDSSAVAALAAPGGPAPVASSSYSATFPRHPDADETPLIDRTVDALGLRNVRAEVNGGSVIAGALPYLERWALPPVSPNLFFWLPLLGRAAQDGVGVLLDGQGGDELFALSPFLFADRLRRGDLVGAVALMGRVPGANHRPSRRAVLEWLRTFGLKGAMPAVAHRARRALRPPGHGAPAWLAPRLARHALHVDPAEDWKRLDGPRWWAHLVDATTEGMGPALTFDHLRRRDTLAGLASRHPIADVDLIETVLALPPELAFHPRHGRPLLREAVTGLLPDEVRLRRRKSGFDGPFHEALGGRDLPLVHRLLGAPDARTAAYTVRPALERELLGAPPAGGERQWWALHTWRLVTAELWLRMQEDVQESARLHREVEVPAADVQLSVRSPLDTTPPADKTAA